MTFQTAALEPGRRAFTTVEIEMPFCSRTYGVAPCAATIARENQIDESEGIGLFGHWDFEFGVSVIDEFGDIPTVPSTSRLSATSVIITPLNDVHFVEAGSVPVSQASPFVTFSVYIKANGTNTGAMLQIWNTGLTVLHGQALVDLVTGQTRRNAGSFGVASGGEPAGNGWFRFFIAVTREDLTAARLRIIFLESYDGAIIWDGAGNNEETLVFGAQLNAGAKPGLYVPTLGSSVVGGGSTSDYCFNTFGTCQDPANYDELGKTLVFSMKDQNVPKNVTAFPSVDRVQFAPTRLTPGEGIGSRASVTITMQDFLDTDSFLDPYVRHRPGKAEERGTFWGRLKARQPYLVGRAVRIREGYVSADGTFGTDTRVRNYIIEEVSGPDHDGRVTIKAKDILKLADNKRAKAPLPSTGSLTAAMTAVQTSLTVGTGEGAQYDADVHVIVDDEIMRITSRTGDTLNVTRAAGGTEARTHDAGAAVQSCFTREDAPVINIIRDLLQDFAGIDPSFVPFTDWQAEEALSLGDYDLSTIIPNPTGVTDLLKEISQATLIDLWWDEVDQEIRLKLQTQFQEDVPLLTDEEHFLAETLRVKDVPSKRISRVLIYYGMRNFADDLDPENFSNGDFDIDAGRESANEFGDVRQRTIFSRWMNGPSPIVGTVDNTTAVNLTGSRLISRFGETPLELSFELDAKDIDDIRVGDVIDVETRVIQTVNGENKITRLQVVEAKPNEAGTRYQYKAFAFFENPETAAATVIAATVSDVDLFVLLGGPAGPVDREITINPGVIVFGTNGGPGITTGNLHPDSQIKITNNGTIAGAGGVGGAGGRGQVDTERYDLFVSFGIRFCTILAKVSEPGFVGEDGGPGIEVTINGITLDNQGTIQGGGGGGGGGNGFAFTNLDFGGATSIPPLSIILEGGGGGGGGRGYNNALGGAAGLAIYNQDGPEFCPAASVIADGAPGASGSLSTGGAGGIGGDGSADDAGNGGAGAGDWAQDGAASENGVPGGKGGPAIRTNGGNIVLETEGTFIGEVV